ncbi:MAG: histidinol-phosphate transaminase [Spirochaetales bacterium]|nr:histidinol-phosphate transaminase [Spirochaetales bacterium]
MNIEDTIKNTFKSGVIANEEYTLHPIECSVKINQNESPYDLPIELKQQVTDKLLHRKWNVYPDFVPESLYQKLSAYLGFDKDNILIGNGSNEMIFTILTAMLESGHTVNIPVPTFTVYGLISSNLNANVNYIAPNDDLSVNVSALREAAKIKGSVTIICSPNNPTGRALTPQDLFSIIEASQGIVVVDEAYIHFGGQTIIDSINKYDTLIILRTFSKAFGLAGLRIGCMISNKNIITQLAKVKLPYNLNIFTLTTLEVVLDNIEFLQKNIDRIMAQKSVLVEGLTKHKELTVYPSDANFILFRTNKPKYIFDELVKRDVLIRTYSSGKYMEGCLRVSIGSPEENQKFLKALDEILG